MNEKEYILRILKGDTSAFNYFVDTYQDMAMSIAYRISRNMQDAEDIVQNSFVKAFRSLASFRLDSKFSTWFYSIVYHTAISNTKKSIFLTDLVEYDANSQQDFSEWDTLEIMDRADKKILINKAMDMIPEGESLILTLFYLEENSIKDIQTITGLTEQNIKVRLHRGRKNLLNSMNNLSPKYSTIKD